MSVSTLNDRTPPGVCGHARPTPARPGSDTEDPAREADDDLEDDVLEGYEEHHAVELLMDELDGMSPDDERFDAKFTVIKEFVLHHVEEEEDEMFPQAREALGEDRLRELGEEMQARADELRAAADDLTKEELYERAKELDIEGRSQMSKRELARALQQAS